MDHILVHLTNLRSLYAEATPSDPKTISDYAWTIVKALLQHCEEIDSVTARQLLAESLQLPTERPSALYSALLAAAIKVANTYPEFRFSTFLKMWNITNLRPEDAVRQQAKDGKSFPSLTERTAKALAHSLLLHPETAENGFDLFLANNGIVILPMLVTRVKEAVGKDGRKYRFVTLTSPEGHEVETISHNLQISPLMPLPEGKRHYINIGQLYTCQLRKKTSATDVTLHEAFLSYKKAAEIFPAEIGYIEAIDATHGHMHIYDAYSRHFVAPVQRFSKEKAGDFIRFIPIVPQESKFKTAIIQSTIPSLSPSSVLSLPEREHLLREIRITHINKEKGYAAWELVDKSHPITELLSPLQLSQGETSPSFTSGYLNLTEELSLSLSSYKAFIYLRRGKDRQKRPHIARLFA